jgi:YrbI family 3-deoxy-D-manno-octulosonate 8-phosphate phosphatase
MVASNRSDSLGLGLIRSAGVQVQVISKEVNPVVAARCKKMNVPCMHGIDDKASALRKLLSESKIDPACAVFVGNDLNDLPCFPIVGWSVVVADALPEVIRHADFVLTKNGGHGAVRELCDLILKRKEVHS